MVRGIRTFGMSSKNFDLNDFGDEQPAPAIKPGGLAARAMGAQAEAQVKLTVEHALESGATEREITEVIWQMSMFGGLPAMQKALEMTHECGSGWVGISNSNHFGIAAYHAMMALPHSYIGFSTTNASPLVTPAGGAERMLGTNPICVAIPAGKELPFVMDMATSAAANGKLEIAERVNKPIPKGWALTKDGKNTQDAAALKQGGLLLPLGSDADHGYHKGYGLGAWVDIFSGVLNGANFGPWVPPFVSFLQPRADQPGKGLGHFVGCWDVDGFRDLQEFQNDMDLWIQRFKATQPAQGVERVMIPGEPEHHQSEYRKINGIPLVDAVVQDLINVGKQLQHPFNP